jgi:hypothetical protein
MRLAGPASKRKNAPGDAKSRNSRQEINVRFTDHDNDAVFKGSAKTSAANALFNPIYVRKMRQIMVGREIHR